MRLPAALLAAVLAACRQSPESSAGGGSRDTAARTCSAVGCDSEFVVTLDSAGPGPVRVEVRVQGRDPVYVAACPAGRGGGCSLEYRFPAFTPEFADVRVVTQAGTKDTTIERVAYETVRPNGAQCEPTCRQAFIRLTAPRSR